MTLNTFPYYSSVGTKHRFRHILRDSLKPQGQCYSKLNESVSCYADACFTYTHKTLHDKNGYRKLQCIRLDGLIVEGELCHICMSMCTFSFLLPTLCSFGCRVSLFCYCCMLLSYSASAYFP